MSRFFSSKYSSLEAYTPGEQPKDMKYIKLNTNESPFPPSKSVLDAVSEQASLLQLYSDPECTPLVAKCAELYGVKKTQLLMTNGSDEILNFAFMAFCDSKNPIVFPDITYGFYPVFAELNGIPYEQIPLKDDFTVNVEDYVGINKNIVIANPNAPTGIALTLDEIERIVSSNPLAILPLPMLRTLLSSDSPITLRAWANQCLPMTLSLKPLFSLQHSRRSPIVCSSTPEKLKMLSSRVMSQGSEIMDLPTQRSRK